MPVYLPWSPRRIPNQSAWGRQGRSIILLAHHTHAPTESISILGRYGSGLLLNYKFSGVESGKPRMEARLNGSKGSLRLDFDEGVLYRAEAGSAEEKPVEI